MKKIYFFGMMTVFGSSLFAQQALKLKTNRTGTETTTTTIQKSGGSAAVNQVTGTFDSNNDYIPGATMNLSFTIQTTNTDQEYIDSLSITFPAGFTINGTSATPTFPTDDSGGGDEQYNGVNGQTISWGDVPTPGSAQDDNYGGIWAGNGITFTINVTIGAGTTGPQMISFFANGDEWPSNGGGGTSGDWSGTVTVNQAAAADVMTISAATNSGCNLTTAEPVMMMIVNNGTAPQSGFPVSYSINGGTPVTETFTATINSGDTAAYTFAAMADLSVQGTYDLAAYTSLAGDASGSNDTAYYLAATTVSQNAPYSTGFEASPVTDLLGWTTMDVDGSGYTWGLVTSSVRTGAYAVRAIELMPMESDDWLFSRCIDFASTNTYRVTWWNRLTSTFVGSIGVYVGTNADTAGMMNIKPVTALSSVTADTYVKDSADFNVAANGTYYIGFRALNNDSNEAVAVRLDDINVIDLGVTTSISNNLVIGVSAYPNPTDGILFISTVAGNSRLEVFNMLGEVVYTQANLGAGQNAIDLGRLNNGSYVVRISNGNDVGVRKISISK